jgi:hypothetical protein
MKQCKVCLQEKVAEYSHVGKNGAKLYKDDKGRLWKANVCPDCQNEQRRKTRAKLKEQKNEG